MLGLRKQPINEPINDRGESHPFKEFNNTSSFKTADESFFGPKPVFDNALSPGQCFNSKEECKNNILRKHVVENIQIRTTHSDPGRMIFRCQNERCQWRLKAKATGYENQWCIQYNPTPHICFQDPSRSNHFNLISSMVADVIRNALTDDADISIKVIRNMVRVRYENVTPKYNKLWRGRELAIARQFGSWERSHSLIKPLFL